MFKLGCTKFDDENQVLWTLASDLLARSFECLGDDFEFGLLTGYKICESAKTEPGLFASLALQIDRAINGCTCARCVYVCALRVINAKNSRVIALRTNNEAINIIAIHARSRTNSASSLLDCRAITRGKRWTLSRCSLFSLYSRADRNERTQEERDRRSHEITRFC